MCAESRTATSVRLDKACNMVELSMLHLDVLACCLNPNPLSMQLRVQLKDVQELMSSMRFFDPAKTSHLSCFFQVSGANVGFRAWYKR